MSKLILQLDSEVEIIIDFDDQTIICTDDRKDDNGAIIAFCEWDEIDEFVRQQMNINKKRTR